MFQFLRPKSPTSQFSATIAEIYPLLTDLSARAWFDSYRPKAAALAHGPSAEALDFVQQALTVDNKLISLNAEKTAKNIWHNKAARRALTEAQPELADITKIRHDFVNQQYFKSLVDLLTLLHKHTLFFDAHTEQNNEIWQWLGLIYQHLPDSFSIKSKQDPAQDQSLIEDQPGKKTYQRVQNWLLADTQKPKLSAFLKDEELTPEFHQAVNDAHIAYTAYKTQGKSKIASKAEPQATFPPMERHVSLKAS